MKNGLDELGRNLSNERCRQTVAVVGNVGIETYLASAKVERGCIPLPREKILASYVKILLNLSSIR